MKSRIGLFSIFLIFFIIQDATSQQITYSGPVQYRSIHTKKATGGGSDKGYNWDVNVDEKFMIEGTFYVTFTGGVSPVGVAMYQMTSIEEVIHIENTVNNELYDEKISQYCYDNLMRYKRTETPGDSRTKKLAVKSERSDPDKPCILSGNLTIISPPSNNKKELNSGKYIIMLMGEIKTDVTYLSYEERKFPCDPTINKPPSSQTKTVNISFPIAIAIEKAFDGSTILEGRKVIKDNRSTDSKDCDGIAGRMGHGDVDCAINENITVSWNLAKKCEALDNVGNELDKRKDISQSQKNRIKNVLAKLNDPSVDPYVFTTMTSIRTVKNMKESDIVLNDKETFMTDLRKIYNKWCEEKNIEDLAKSITTLDKQIVTIINKLQEYYLREHMLSPGQVVIKDWIADQQRNPNSVYSCYGGK